MSVLIGSVQCGGCKQPIDESPSLPVEQRKPCSSCGSLGRIHNVEIQEEVQLSAGLGIKQRRPGFKKPIYEAIGRPDLHRNTGRLSFLVRIIDRLRNRYHEHITDIETKEVIRSVDEPLTAHVNRGSATKLIHRAEPPEGEA